MAGKIIKITGTDQTKDNQRTRPLRLDYAQPTTIPPNTMRENRIEDVFIPFYDRPGYLTDNADQMQVRGGAFEIPSGDGRMPAKNLGE